MESAPSALASRRPGGLLAPTLNTTGWSGRPISTGATVKDLLAERVRISSLPPPSPALSEFSAVFDPPATPGSTTFHFEAHHHFDFADEPVTPDLSGDNSPAVSAEDDAQAVFEPVQDHEDREPIARQATPPFSPSQTSFHTDRLSVQSTDFSTCSPSPSPSIGSVRIAQITKVPHRPFDFYHPRESIGASSLISDSVEDAPEEVEETIWNAKALARSSFVGRLPHDLDAILRSTGEESSAARNETEEAAGLGLPAASAAPHDDEPVEMPTPPALPQSSSKGSDLSGESWKATLDAAVDQLSNDPAIKPEEDAMRRMKSILGAFLSAFCSLFEADPPRRRAGPKTRIISKAPWDVEATAQESEETSSLPQSSSRRSFDVLSSVSSATSGRPSTGKTSKDRQMELSSFGKTPRSQSFNALASGRATAPHRREPQVQGLGIDLDASPILAASDSKRSLPSLLKASPSLQLGEAFPDVGAASLAAYAEKASSTFTRPPNVRSGSSGRLPRTARTPPLVALDSVLSGTPKSITPPMSAPASITLFAQSPAIAHSDSKASFPFSTSTSNGSSSPPLSTVGALHALGPTSSSPATTSYFPAVQGNDSSAASSSGFSGHKLISLEEARQREVERSAAAKRKAASTPPLEASGVPQDRNVVRVAQPHTRESTSESISSRRGVQAPAPIVATSSPTAMPKPLKPKKSGFLKRMMGGGGGSDKHHDKERTQVPSVPSLDQARPSISSSASIPSLATATPPSSLGKASGLRVVEPRPINKSSNSRVSFLPPPVIDPGTRRRTAAPAPSLSLRPVSMAFSAGLPADFMSAMEAEAAQKSSASEAASPPASLRSPPPFPPASLAPSPALSASRLPALSEPLASPPLAASIKSSTSPTAPSILFDDVPLASLMTTTSTPAAFNPLSPSAHPALDAQSSPAHSVLAAKDVTPERYAALVDEFAHAKRAWTRMQYDLESQVRALEDEVVRLGGGAGSRCDKCGAEASGGDAAMLRTSVMQRPRAKVSNGAGTLFGSTTQS